MSISCRVTRYKEKISVQPVGEHRFTSKVQEARLVAGRNISRAALAGIVLATAMLPCAQAKSAPAEPAPNAVYFEARLVEFHALNGANTWTLLRTSLPKAAHMKRGKPVDGRPNLYIVAPGTQMHEENEPGLDHNLVISWPPPERVDGVEFDIYYAISLDPTLDADPRSERDIIMATQQSFRPPADFDFASIPGAALLRESLNIRTIAELDGFRHADGSLPRLVVVPARAVLRAVVRELPEATSKEPSATNQRSDNSQEGPRTAPVTDPKPPQ